jgi:GMP reductase
MAHALTSHNMLTAIHKFYDYTIWQENVKNNAEVMDYIFVSSGISEQDFKNLIAVINLTNCSKICLDIANGYTNTFIAFVQKVRAAFPQKIIMAGNVVTAEMTEELLLSGADIVKVGIGSGSVCTTRKKTGVGYPQLSAIIECADAAHGLNGYICADGGCTSSGDVAKAFAAGADFVMLGGMFAGHDECSGEIFTVGETLAKRFYGMSSTEAMCKHYGKLADYRTSEGKAVNVPYRGKVENTVHDILGGLRSACTYVGTEQIKEISKCTTFIRVTQQLNEIYTQNEVDY